MLGLRLGNITPNRADAAREAVVVPQLLVHPLHGVTLPACTIHASMILTTGSITGDITG